MRNVFLFTGVILFLYLFSYVKEIYLTNDFLREDIFILESEIYEKDSLINTLQKDNFKLREELKRKTIKKPKKKKRMVKEVKVEEVIPVKETPQTIVDTTKTN